MKEFIFRLDGINSDEFNSRYAEFELKDNYLSLVAESVDQRLKIDELDIGNKTIIKLDTEFLFRLSRRSGNIVLKVHDPKKTC